MKKFLSMVMVGVMALALSGAAFAQAPAGYVASKGGEKFHTTECPVAKKITADKLVKFATPDEAIKAGYSACKTCNPPPSADALVVTKAGGKYHKQSCRIVAGMDTANKVYYKDVAAAEKDGYKPCAICFKK
ncbi:MAG: hypothetical protein HQL17_02355 [Candidatus Omnitrophica bacterium]|nr:hypothetical protein [Candidatus Omnitrophota bacterium]